MTKNAEEFDLRDFTPYLLNIASEVESLDFAKVYKSRYGMSRPEWRVLFHLGRYGEMTAKEISFRARIHKTKISRAVRSLEERRFLGRKVLDSDRRSEILTLKSQGQAAYRDLSQAAAAFEAKLEKRLGVRDTRLLKRVLRKLAGGDA